MSDIQPPSRRVFRRKRVHMGNATITMLENQALRTAITAKDTGLMCKTCGRRKVWAKLKTKYEFAKGTIYRSWICSDCNSTLKEDTL